MSRSMINLRVALILISLMILTYWGYGCSPAADQRTQSAKTKNSFSLTELYSGKMINFPGDFAGRRTLVVFFSTG